jgi:hypothetical protein
LQNTFANTFVFALADTRDDQSTVDDWLSERDAELGS